jgi:hypothetical protein
MRRLLYRVSNQPLTDDEGDQTREQRGGTPD